MDGRLAIAVQKASEEKARWAKTSQSHIEELLRSALANGSFHRLEDVVRGAALVGLPLGLRNAFVSECQLLALHGGAAGPGAVGSRRLTGADPTVLDPIKSQLGSAKSDQLPAKSELITGKLSEVLSKSSNKVQASSFEELYNVISNEKLTDGTMLDLPSGSAADLAAVLVEIPYAALDELLGHSPVLSGLQELSSWSADPTLSKLPVLQFLDRLYSVSDDATASPFAQELQPQKLKEAVDAFLKKADSNYESKFPEFTKVFREFIDRLSSDSPESFLSLSAETPSVSTQQVSKNKQDKQARGLEKLIMAIIRRYREPKYYIPILGMILTYMRYLKLAKNWMSLLVKVHNMGANTVPNTIIPLFNWTIDLNSPTFSQYVSLLRAIVALIPAPLFPYVQAVTRLLKKVGPVITWALTADKMLKAILAYHKKHNISTPIWKLLQFGDRLGMEPLETMSATFMTTIFVVFIFRNRLGDIKKAITTILRLRRIYTKGLQSKDILGNPLSKPDELLGVRLQVVGYAVSCLWSVLPTLDDVVAALEHLPPNFGDNEDSPYDLILPSFTRD